MQLTRFVERSFHCETAEERDEWVAACEVVKKKLEEKNIARRMDDDARGIVPGRFELFYLLILWLHLYFLNRRRNIESFLFSSHPYLPPPALSISLEKTVTLDDFEMLKVLGKGTFGKVIIVHTLGDITFSYFFLTLSFVFLFIFI